jgi:hypothetical protein
LFKYRRKTARKHFERNQSSPAKEALNPSESKQNIKQQSRLHNIMRQMEKLEREKVTKKIPFGFAFTSKAFLASAHC